VDGLAEEADCGKLTDAGHSVSSPALCSQSRSILKPSSHEQGTDTRRLELDGFCAGNLLASRCPAGPPAPTCSAKPWSAHIPCYRLAFIAPTRARRSTTATEFPRSR
jgi:hypothetical protein